MTSSRNSYSTMRMMSISLIPLLMAANNTINAITIAISFTIAYTTMIFATFLMPSSIPVRLRFIFSTLFCALMVSLFASLIRWLDPFLFHRNFLYMFMPCFCAPVFHTALALDQPVSDTEQLWTNIVKGFIMGIALFLFGLLRELLATGTASFQAISRTQPAVLLPCIAEPFGAFLLIAIGLASGKKIVQIIKRGSL